MPLLDAPVLTDRLSEGRKDAECCTATRSAILDHIRAIFNHAMLIAAKFSGDFSDRDV